VTRMNAEFMSTTDQSCLNRFVTDAEWDVERLNARRLELLQENPATRYVHHGVIALDDVLIDRDGKQELGMGACQFRSGQGQTRHMHLVMAAYSLLMRQLRNRHATKWALGRLTTIGQACRAIVDETLRATLQWAMTQIAKHSQKTSTRFRPIGVELAFCKSSALIQTGT
jgi:hypothetical protein